jgi:hypothetical protein
MLIELAALHTAPLGCKAEEWLVLRKLGDKERSDTHTRSTRPPWGATHTEVGAATAMARLLC